jgi:D-alanyl-D-alanine carboxypeptidase
MIRRIVALAALLLAVAGCAQPDPVNAARDLPALIDSWHARSGAMGVAMAVARPGNDAWAGARGLADRDARTALERDDLFRIGSITKTFTAVVVLQLVEEGKLRLDDSVRRYIPDFHWDDAITVRQLLTHTSGIPDYQSVNGFTERQRKDRGKRWTAEELVGLVADRDLGFQPGTRFSYSNTNYALLGQVVRAAAGAPWAMAHTFIPSVENVPGGVIAGYSDADGDGRSDNIGGGSWPALETEGEAVGNIVSTAEDVLRFDVALFRGQLLRPESMDAMLGAGTEYGLGVQHWQAASGVAAVGHGGSDPGFGASMAYLPDHDIAVVVLVNDSNVDPNDLVAVTARLLVRTDT